MKKRAFLTLMGKGRDARGRADQDQDGILPPGHSVVSSPRSPVFYHDVCFSYQIQASSLLSISTMEKAIASVVSGAVAVFGLACIFTVLTRPSVNECDMTYMYPKCHHGCLFPLVWSGQNPFSSLYPSDVVCHGSITLCSCYLVESARP
eukprot:m.203389 g.203389  ORF g.203389 m.203389 type:complete len:149 (-) comp16874_c1_seq71:2917-3363(-)